jgi:hypothetical protein
MLVDDPVAAVTPFSRGSRLPTSDDIQRIKSLSGRFFVTSVAQPKRNKPTEAVFKKFVELEGIRVHTIDSRCGVVRFRKQMGASDWHFELFNGAFEA